VTKAKLHIPAWAKPLAPIVAAGAALLATIGAGSPALAQPPPHRGPAAVAPPRAGGWGRGGPGGGPRGGPGPAWNRGGGPGWNRGGPNPGPGWGRGAPPPGPNWDQRRYNGYYVGGRWYYGAPEPPAFATPSFRPGFTPWRRGSFLPPAYQGYVVDEYWREHLRRPPAGYHWVQVGGEFLLVSASTGLIFDVVTGG
jgi:Ni/Co efflux regulator RcnB